MPFYPPPLARSSTIAFIAEAVRQEANGKLTAIGMYAGGGILFTPPTPLPAAIPLAIAFLFREGEGTFSGRFKIIAPSQTVLIEQDMGQVTKKPDEPMILLLQFANFIVPEVGDYGFEVALDDQRYHLVVSILQGAGAPIA
jgi:hypothetical protein